MFAAKPHSLLIPSDGSFHAAKAPTAPPKTKDDWKALLEGESQKLGRLQERLYAHGRFAVLIILQALDAAGKDGTIRHVFDGVNPSGLRVAAFKQPTHHELAHDFLWRATLQLPERGGITIFNRSYYEEVLVVRVHPDFLAPQQLPSPPSAKLWADRLRAIADYERYLAEQGTLILKFWLNVSRAEQRKRFLERIDEPKKNWKFNLGDLDERDRWDDYMLAYEEAFRVTSSPWAPWYVVPSDDKDYQRWQVATLINSALEDLGLDFPRPDKEAREALTKAKARLLAQSD
jgi:PPK2 family polyphosphate:nucleotide phosphotransferase